VHLLFPLPISFLTDPLLWYNILHVMYVGCIAEAAPGAAGGAHGRNREDEAAAVAHKQRVEVEANAEIRKVEARAATS
jgi:hypothetical protein